MRASLLFWCFVIDKRPPKQGYIYLFGLVYCIEFTFFGFLIHYLVFLFFYFFHVFAYFGFVAVP